MCLTRTSWRIFSFLVQVYHRGRLLIWQIPTVLQCPHLSLTCKARLRVRYQWRIRKFTIWTSRSITMPTMVQLSQILLMQLLILRQWTGHQRIFHWKFNLQITKSSKTSLWKIQSRKYQHRITKSQYRLYNHKSPRVPLNMDTKNLKTWHNCKLKSKIIR